MQNDVVRAPQKTSIEEAESSNLKQLIKLRPNLAFDGKLKQWILDRTMDEWVEDVFPSAAIFKGFDELIWEHFIIVVYKEPLTNKFSSMIIDKLGLTHFNSIDISHQSRFYPAVENLTMQNKKSNVRKSIAVSLLRKYVDIEPELIKKIVPQMKYDYDATTAGDLANGCKLFSHCTPKDLGKSLVQMGVLHDRYVRSVLLDVVYENKMEIIDSNNELVFYLGEQLEQLFNPLSEYSPEQTEYVYKSPDEEHESETDDPLVASICNELLQIQTNFTLSLVEFLQNFLIPLRIEVANDEIDGLSMPKLNRLLPPTIDEVTRINCIFLDALKSATPYGSLEVLKACSVTIPYFYKAYTRHEAATKNFSKDIKLFMSKFRSKIPNREVYTEMKLETLIRGPQEKLMKLKLIIERLWINENVSHNDISKEWYNNIIEVIHSFGTLEKPMSAYNTRVFTPSGKILTELAKGWPLELQYKWLKRRVVGVFDLVDANDKTKRDLLVIFSDYVVFLNVIDGESYYNNVGNKPLISDILMNSLINEVPLPPKIPKLQVVAHSYIDKVLVSMYGTSSLRFDLHSGCESIPLTYELASNSANTSEVAELVTKAQILEKDTAFHLFKFTQNDLQVYSTAHEIGAYSIEKIKSQFALFLNMSPSMDLLEKHGLSMALFACFTQDHRVKLSKLTWDNSMKEITIKLTDLAKNLVEELYNAFPEYFSSLHSPFFEELLSLNTHLIERIGRNFHENEETGQQNDNVQALEASSDKGLQSLQKKDKSFGTITTFRSIKSDLKDVPKNTVPSNHERNNGITEAVKSKNKMKKDKANTTAKSSSFLKRLKRIFSRNTNVQKIDKNLTTIGQPKDINKRLSVSTIGKQNPLKSSTLRSSNFGEQGVKASMNSSEANHRISSVIHTPDILHNSTETEPQVDKVTIPVSEKRLSVNSDPNLDEGIDRNVTKSPTNDDNPDIATNSNDKTNGSDGPNLLYKERLRQSQLFNDDLFGDIGSAEYEIISSQKDGESSEFKVKGPTSSRLNTEEDCEKSDQNQIPSRVISSAESEFPYSSGIEEKSPSLNMPSTYELVGKDSEVLESPIKKPSLSEEIISERQCIFPGIPELSTTRIAFGRSPSFVQLFEGMRAILDINDEPSNWRRLSSEPSLNGDYIIKKQIKRNDNVLEENNLTDHESVRQQQLHRIPAEEEAAHSSPDSSELGLSDNNSNASRIGNELREIAETEFNSTNAEETAAPGFQNFKVINMSPTKITNFRATGNGTHAVYPKISSEKHDTMLEELSYTSELKNENLRLVELSFNSQEEFCSDNSHATSPGDSEIGTPRQFGLEDGSVEDFTSAPDKNSEYGTETLTAFDYGKKEEHKDTSNSGVHQQAILDDLDFSSFNMTFDISDTNDTTQPSAVDEGMQGFLSKRHISPQEPVFYRLPNSTESGETFFSCVDDQRNKSQKSKCYLPATSQNYDDEPMWVSPSKLDMFDLSKQPDSVFRNTKLRSVTDKQNYALPPKLKEKDKSSLSDEPILLPDSSYAYLGSLLSDEELHQIELRSNDRPVRLQFKP